MFLFSFCIGLVGVPSASATFATQGERIAFFRTPAGESDTELFTIRLDGTGARRLTDNDIDEYDPRISADGSRIVFWAIPGDGTDSELYTIWSDGTHRRRLTDDDVFDGTATWSPTGGRIAWVSGRRSNQEDIFTMHPDGTHIQRVTYSEGPEWMPSWSPDGEHDRVQLVRRRRGLGGIADPPFPGRHRLQRPDQQRRHR